MTPVTVVGAGFAGCEAAWTLAQNGIPVTLWEMKPRKFSPAHHSPDFAELICSNSFKASRLESAAGLLKAEMERLGSLCVPCAKETAVAAGGALAVDRDRFSALVTETNPRDHPLIAVREGEVTEIPDGNVIDRHRPAHLRGAFRRHRRADLGGVSSASLTPPPPLWRRPASIWTRCSSLPGMVGGTMTISTAPLTRRSYEKLRRGTGKRRERGAQGV